MRNVFPFVPVRATQRPFECVRGVSGYCAFAANGFLRLVMVALCNRADHYIGAPLQISTGYVSWQRYCTASSSGRQPNFAALNRGRHLCSAGRPSGWALAHILVIACFVNGKISVFGMSSNNKWRWWMCTVAGRPPLALSLHHHMNRVHSGCGGHDYSTIKTYNGFITSPPGRVRSIAISVSVCLSVRSHISQITYPNFTNFSVQVRPYLWPWLGPSVTTT